MLNIIPKTVRRRNKKIIITRFVVFSALYISFTLLIVNIVLFVVYTENKAQISMLNSVKNSSADPKGKVFNANPDEIFKVLEIVKEKKEHFKPEYISNAFQLVNKYSKDVQIKDITVDFGKKFAGINITGVTGKRDLLISLLEHVKNTDHVVFASIPLNSLVAVEDGLKFTLNIQFDYE